MYKIECYKCRSNGHMAHACILNWALKKAKNITNKHENKVKQVWRRKKAELEGDNVECVLNIENINSC